METVKCYCCDQFTIRGKAETGYCLDYNLPTWKSTVRKCQEHVLAEVGDFCYYHCPFRCDFDCGQLCGEESPSVINIHYCPELQSRINDALGGQYEYTSYTLNDRSEIVENYVSIRHGYESWVDADLTRDYRWNVGWFR